MKELDYIIQAEHITKSFGEKTVLNDVSLNVKRGEFVTILGSSGCGKTTMLRILAGFETPTSGKIRMNGHDITTMPPYRRPMNTVFQRYALFPHLNVYENIAFGLKLQGIKEKEMDRRVIQALKMVGMSDYEERDVNSLSGGQQQRVAIARAIVNKPHVLLLDEPLSALDHKMRKDMQLELKQMHKKLGITFIYVTHDQEEALTLSDTIIVMNDGVIQQIGTPTDIYNEPANSFVANFIGESNILNGRMLKDMEVEVMGVNAECVDKGFATDEPVDVVIRPEDVYMLKKPEAGMWRGKVSSCIFKGVHYEMFVDTPNGYEVQVHDYNAFEAGTEVGMLVKPEDIHVMKKERTCNTAEGEMVDSNHVAVFGNEFECAETGLEKGDKVLVEFDFDKVELTDNPEDGTAEAQINFILYKGNHYHITLKTKDGEKIYVNTNDVWEDYDDVGINIKASDLRITKQ
ncbi:MAG: ABC transporter ATP-binding protein [Bacteroidaceae bacterium]|jgi:spermidine/putrescine transport system ATP-binding protein|nr:ABC transporter ATP-binding protein [Bacteroidaceae bacterium]